MVIVSSGLLFGHTIGAQAFGSRSPWCKGVCGKDAGPKPTGTSSRRSLHQRVGCPKGKGHPTAETMTNAALGTDARCVHDLTGTARSAKLGKMNLSLSEFELIERYFASATMRREDVLAGIGDDAALLQVLPHHDVVSAITTLVEGVHFQPGTHPRSVGHRVLAIALSRLAATGATPAWATLSLVLPEADEAWLAPFSSGFVQLAERHQVQLVGGDTVRGPLTVTVATTGFVPMGQALDRGGARVGNLIYVTGTLGEAALALLAENGSIHPPTKIRAQFQARLDAPEPRVAEGRRLAGLATAATDLPDGLAAGLRELLESSALGATVYASQLPLSAQSALWLPAAGGQDLLLHGGGDYELCFTIPSDKQAELEVAFSSLKGHCNWIGMVEKTPGLRCVFEDGAVNCLW